MATKVISWGTGTGDITLTYNGQGDGTISISSDANNLYEARSKTITVKTTDGSNIQRTVTIKQAAKVRTDISNAIVTAANQTYSGTAKTPTPTVTLNGVTIPSSGYDVAYSNNTNAGTATITINGKGEYTGTATGTFTIAKASRTLSFADAYVVLAPSGNITKTATPSAGSGDGAITYSISSTTYATINSSSGKVTAKTSDGSAIVTATIAEGTNYLSATASYNLYVFATTHNFDYTGSVQNITLPPGSYKLQCWGAQGGSNSADSTHGITAQAGGKGGYSEGVLTIAEQLTLYAFVGGQGASSGNGGWNGGGGSKGSDENTSGNTYGTSKFACGGGATDFSLVTSAITVDDFCYKRTAASYLARIIVAGGGSGGAMGYKAVTTQVTEWQTVGTLNASGGSLNGHTCTAQKFTSGGNYYLRLKFPLNTDVFTSGDKLRVTINGTYSYWYFDWLSSSWANTMIYNKSTNSATCTYVSCPGSDYQLTAQVRTTSAYFSGTITVEKEVTSTTVTEERKSQAGFYGGGNAGGEGNTGCGGTQSDGFRFGYGQGNTSSNDYMYRSGCSGGGWYGGKINASNVTFDVIKWSGGGSGFVNTSASAGNRPSGYTGIELDSGSTTAGNTSFPSTGGGTETGHSGNGYARITRLS